MIEALLAMAIVGFIWAAAAAVLTQVPAQAARWEAAAAMQQRVRVIEARVGVLAASAAVIEASVEGRVIRIPGVWPRRLGATRPGAQAEVSSVAATFLTRNGAQREMTLLEPLAASGGDVAVAPGAGCGSAVACALREGDIVLVAAADGACGLYRVTAAGARVRLDALMMQGRASFDPGSAMLPVRVDVIAFDAGESAIRRYDGYRSDNVMIDEVSAMSFGWPAGVLGDGPFVGTGPLAYDVDQLMVREVTLGVDLVDSTGRITRRTSLAWRTGPWQ